MTSAHRKGGQSDGWMITGPERMRSHYYSMVENHVSALFVLAYHHRCKYTFAIRRTLTHTNQDHSFNRLPPQHGLEVQPRAPY